MHHLRAIGLLLVLLSPSGAAALASGDPTRPQPFVQEVMERIDAERLRATVDRLAAFGTRHTLSETESETRGIGAARRWILAEFESFGGALRAELEGFDVPPGERRLPSGGRIVNVVAVLPGTMPEAANRRYYVLGHADSRASDPMNAESDAPGANDDASGVALLLELARVLAETPLDSTVVFAATSGEEQGLFGARELVERARSAGWEVAGVLNNDTVGDPSNPAGPDAPGRVRVFSEGVPEQPDAEELRRIRANSMSSDGPSRQLARFVDEIARRETTTVRPMLVFRNDRFLRGGDHTPFARAGFPAVRFCEVFENYDRQHQDVRVEDGVQYGDLPEHVDAQYLANVTKLNAAVLVHLANAPSVPADTRIVAAQLMNETLLRWTASPEPDVAGYEVVWRDTTSPVWQFGRDVGMVTEATLNISKDNNFFGIRAYDADGYRSPVGFAVAARE